MLNERCFHLAVTRFAAVYICSSADGHQDAITAFLIDLHILLTFLGGNLGLTPISLYVIDVLKEKMLTFLSSHSSLEWFYSLQ